MNTSKLQAFATDARRQLMNAVQARLDSALVPNSDAQVDDPRAFDFLQREIEQAGGLSSWPDQHEWPAGSACSRETRRV